MAVSYGLAHGFRRSSLFRWSMLPTLRKEGSVHIPDGFVNIGTAAVTYGFGRGHCLASDAQSIKEREVPLMGVWLRSFSPRRDQF